MGTKQKTEVNYGGWTDRNEREGGIAFPSPRLNAVIFTPDTIPNFLNEEMGLHTFVEKYTVENSQRAESVIKN